MSSTFVPLIIAKESDLDGLRLRLAVDFTDGVTTFSPRAPNSEYTFSFNDPDPVKIAQVLKNQADGYTKARDAKNLPSGPYDPGAILAPQKPKDQVDADAYRVLVGEYIVALKIKKDSKLSVLVSDESLAGRAQKLIDDFRTEYLSFFGGLPPA